MAISKNFKGISTARLGFLCLIVVIFLQTCQTQSSNDYLEFADVNGQIIPIYPFDLIEDSATVIPLSVLFEDIEIIQLETKDECLIASGRVTLTDHSIIVSANNRRNPARVLEFDLNGNYLREYGRSGKGPGEHLGHMRPSIHYYPEMNRIHTSFIGRDDEEHEFDLDGNFIRNIILPCDHTSHPIRLSEDKYFVSGRVSGQPKYKRDSFQLIYFRPDGSWISSIPRQYYPDKGANGYMPGSYISKWQYGHFWSYYSETNDTIYQVGANQIIPRAICRFGNNHSQAGQMVQPDTQIGRYSMNILKETDNFIYIKKNHLYNLEVNEWSQGKWESMSYSNYSTILMNKESGQGFNLRFKDDLLGIIQPYKYGLDMTWGDYGTARIVNAVDIMEWLEEAKDKESIPEKARDRIRKLESQIDENSNPIIFLFKERPEKEFAKRIKEYQHL